MEEVDRAPEAVEEQDLMTRMAGLLEAEEAQSAEPENEQTDQKLESVEAETDDGEKVETEAKDQEDAPEYVDIRWGSETKKVTKEEYRNLAEQGYNVTQKLQSVAEKERILQAQQEQVQQQAVFQEQLADHIATVKSLDNQLAEYKKVDWHQLAQDDPMRYLTANQAYQQLKDARAEAVGNYNTAANQLTQKQQQARAEIIQRETKLLADAVPEFRGPKATQAKADLVAYLQNTGFSADEVNGLMDHRVAKMAWQAMQYSKLQDSKPAVSKKLSEAPKVVKGTATNVPSQQLQQLKKLAKQGNEKAIHALIERSL